jgi:hypothetical protein
MENVVNHPRLDDMEAVRVREERRRARVYQEQTAEFNAWFDAKFKAAVAEGSLFNNDLTDAIREAFDEFRKLTTEQVLRAVDAARADFAARLMEAERDRMIAQTRERAFAERMKEAEAALTELRMAVRGDVIAAADDLRQRVLDTSAGAVVELRSELDSKFEARLAESERRAERTEARAQAAETALTELRGLVRNDVIQLSDDLRERTRDAAAAPAAELRADVGEKFAALRSEFGEKFASLSARPVFDQGQIDRAVEAAVARTGIETRAEFDRALDSRLKEKERALDERIGEFERRTLAAEERARSIETVVVKLRQQVGDDAIRVADDLRARTRDAAVAAAIELRFELESKFDARLKEAEKRTDAAEARAQAAERAQAEVRAVIRDDAIQLADDLRARAHDALAAATVELRTDVGERFAALRSEFGEKIAALSERPVFDQGQIDRAVEAAVARGRAEMRGEFDRALEAERREFASRLEAVKKRAVDALESRPVFDQGWIDRAVEAAVARTRAELRAEYGGALEAQKCEFAAQIGELKERMETVVGRLPVARAWAPDTVTYRGAFVVDDGSTWQAVTDTAKRPGAGEDWVCIAKGGRDGVDGKSPYVRGVFDLRDCYSAMDVIAYEGQGYIATRDNPGVPGVDDGWLLITVRGTKGQRGASGPRGAKGDRGTSGERIHSWQVDRERYRASPLMADGVVGPMLELRPLFEQYQIETS